MADFAFFSQPYLTHRKLDLSTLVFVKSPFLGCTPIAYFLLVWFGSRRHCGQGHQGGEDQGGR